MDFEKFKAYFNEHDFFSRNSGMKLVELGEGYAKVELIVEEKSKNFMGSMYNHVYYKY